MGNAADFTGPINEAIGGIVTNLLNTGSTAMEENRTREDN